jgi:MHS family alpha-ketoglutarate permease-like MFS transporter
MADPVRIGALLAIVALLMRRNLHETEQFVAARHTVQRDSSLKALLKYPREVLLVVGLTMGGTTAFYTYTTYMQKFLGCRSVSRTSRRRSSPAAR